MFFAATLAWSGSAMAMCPTPSKTGNVVYDNMAQQQFYACLQQQAARTPAPAPAYPQPSGQINFNHLDTSIPAQIGANTSASIASIRQQQMQREQLQMQREQQQLQNEMLRLQIEQMQRQMNQ